MRSLVERVAATTGAGCDVDYVRGLPPVVNDPRAVALMRAAALETVGTDHVVVTPQSMGGEDFGWFAEVDAHRAGPARHPRRRPAAGPAPGHVRRRRAGDRHRRPADGAHRAARAGGRRGTPVAPGKRGARRHSARRTVDERREPDDEFHRPADAPARRRRRARPSTRCPRTSSSPRSSTPPPATSGASSWPACCARPAARTCPTRSRTRCAVTVATGVRSRRCTPPRTPATCPRRSASPGWRRSCAVPAPVRDPASGARRLGRPPAARPPRRRRHQGGDRRRPGERRHLAVAGASARARSPVDALGDVLSDVLLDLAPVTRPGRPARPPRRSSPWSRAAPTWRAGSSLGLDPLGVQAASGRAAGPLRPGRRRPPGRRARGPADGRRRRHRVRRRRRLGGGGARLLARRRRRLPAGADRGRAERRRGVRRSWSSATARAPTSSRRSPRCAPPAGCGTGSARSAAPRRRRAPSGSTRSPRR